MSYSVINNYIQRDGFVMVSNLLIQYQQELNLSNKELTFLIKVMKHKENYKLHDEQLDPTVSKRTLQRCRKSLLEKGILTFKVWKSQDAQGHIVTEGITYDLSLLEEKLQKLSNAIAEKKEEKINKEAENYIIEFSENSSIRKYFKDWENHYGDTYVLTPYEKKWYSSLNEEEQKAISNIFDFCEENKLFKEITPRLVLFAKSKYRFEQLKEYSKEISRKVEYCYVPEKTEWDLKVEKIIRGEI